MSSVAIEMPSYCQRVREVIDDLEINQAQAARLAGITPSRLSRICSGEDFPREETQAKLAAGLMLPPYVFYMPREQAAPVVDVAKQSLKNLGKIR